VARACVVHLLSNEEWYGEVQRLRAQGRGYRAIAHQLGLHRATVRKYAAAPACPQPAPRRGRHRGIDPFVAYLRERGYQGNYQRVAVAVAPWREQPAACGQRPKRLGPAAPAACGQRPKRLGPAAPAARRRSPRQLAWWLGRPDADLTDRQRTTLTALLAEQPALTEARTLALAFGQLLRERDGTALAGWLVAAEASGSAALRGFAAGLRRDQAAVQAALDHAWSSGQVEGQVNRLKLLKRQAYGRAGFAQLRRRYLLAS
jgi:transposase